MLPGLGGDVTAEGCGLGDISIGVGSPVMGEVYDEGPEETEGDRNHDFNT